jgi:hypothetical protein
MIEQPYSGRMLKQVLNPLHVYIWGTVILTTSTLNSLDITAFISARKSL